MVRMAGPREPGGCLGSIASPRPGSAPRYDAVATGNLPCSPTPPARVFLVADAGLWRDALAQVLHGLAPDLVLAGCGAAPPESLAQGLPLAPDLIVLDAAMSAGDPVQFLRKQPAFGRRPMVLALVRLEDPVTLNRLAEMQVPGLVEASQPFEIVREALDDLVRGRAYRTAAVTRILERLRADPSAFPKFLTGREQDLLRHVLQGRTNRSIAEQMQLSPRSVETFRYRLMRKVGARNVAGLIQYALRHGLVDG